MPSSPPSRSTALKSAAACRSPAMTAQASDGRSAPRSSWCTRSGTNTRPRGTPGRYSSSACSGARADPDGDRPVLVRHATCQFLAGLHAAAAAFRADAAMFMHGRVLLALLRAKPAGGGADAEHAAHHFVIGTCPPGHDAAGDVADVGAIEVQADALGQLLHHALRQAGVGTGGTGLGAGIAFLDAADQGIIDLALDGRVGADHLAGVHGGLLVGGQTATGRSLA